jgi:RNA polymerase sigma-70 factor, ECF subfamily
VSDEELMAAYAAGDIRAFDELFVRFAPKLHAFFVRSFQDVALADDLLQDCFMKLHRARGDYRRGAPVRSWLFAIAARLRLDALRRRYRLREDVCAETVERLGDADPDGIQGPENLADRAALADAVRCAMERLPPAQRIVVHLHRIESRSFGDIARLLGVSEGSVRQRAFRGYIALRKALGPLVAERAPQR